MIPMRNAYTRGLGAFVWLIWSIGVFAQSPPPSQALPSHPSSSSPPGSPGQPNSDEVDFKHENTFIDVSDALRSKQYVHRAILNSLVRETNRFALGHFYISHMMGFNAVWQKDPKTYVKYSGGLMGLALGYISPWGHALELGAELSVVSNAFLGYKYYMKPWKMGLWGFAGGGLGSEVKALSFADGPPEASSYSGSRNMVFGSLGLLVPTIDVGFKAEVRLNFYGSDRAIFTSGVGLIVFL